VADERRTYTIEEANALLPEVRAVLLQLAVEKGRLEQVVTALTAHAGAEVATGTPRTPMPSPGRRRR
jgi:hypothetical protein